MSLEDQINQDLKAAMKKQDKTTLRGLRAIKAAILLYKTSGASKTLDTTSEIKLLQKLVKQRQESLEIYEEQSRDDLATTEREEIEVIQQYLPKAMDEEELRKEVNGIIKELNAENMSDMGRVMQTAQQKLGGRVDGKTLASVIKEQLS